MTGGQPIGQLISSSLAINVHVKITKIEECFCHYLKTNEMKKYNTRL